MRQRVNPFEPHAQATVLVCACVAGAIAARVGARDRVVLGVALVGGLVGYRVSIIAFGQQHRSQDL